MLFACSTWDNLTDPGSHQYSVPSNNIGIGHFFTPTVAEKPAGGSLLYDQIISPGSYFVTVLVLITPTLFLFSSLKNPSLQIWLWLLLNGFLVNGISYIFWFKALEYGDTSVTSNALYLTPFLSLVYIALFLGEKILLSSVVGLVIIVVGIILQSVNLRQRYL